MAKLPITLLYVEDDEDIAQEVIEFLSRKVVCLEYAKDGKEAYEKFQKSKIDILITDIQMPKMNGIELIAKIREERSSIPVIITTAYNDVEYLLESINLGIDGYLLKPLDLEKMANRVSKVIEPVLMQRRIEELNDQLIEMNAELEARIARAVWENTRYLQEENAKIKEVAFYDSLTGVANRSLIYALLEKEITKAQRYNTRFALFFLDLDNFKSINDTFGHYIGDRVLVEFVKRVQSIIRESDTLGRLGGDEFLLIADDVHERNSVHILAQKILGVLDKDFVVENQDIRVTCSIGISCFPKDALTMEDLIKNADKAMYSVKRATKEGIAFYSKRLH